MASYTRQSSFSDGDTISSSLFNNEYNQLVTAFSYSSSGTTGHRHDGTAGEGGNIPTVGDQDFLNKITVDSTNNRWGVFVQVSGSAVEQIRIQDGGIVPVTDSDVDLGTSSLYFKAAYIDAITTTGDVAVGGNLTVTGTTTFNGGTITMGDAATDNVVFGANVDSHIIPDDDGTYDLGSSTQEWKDIYIDGTAYVDAINFNGTAITSTAAELNILDGVTSTAAELNILDGVTATATELNLLDGVTATTAELNILDGVTSTAAELNILDGVTATATELNLIDGVTATTAELNILDGVTATATEINLLDGVTSTTAELNILDGKDFLDEDDMASDSATGIASQQSIKAYVDAQQDTVDTFAEVLALSNTTGGTDIAVGTGDDITFADSSKAIFGAGSDLQIYHDASDSIILDNGTGNLKIQADDLVLKNADGSKEYLKGTSGGSVRIRHNNATKFETTSTGIDVTGTATMDGLTVDGNTILQNTGDSFRSLDFNSNRSASDLTLARLDSQWNGTDVARIQISSGSDATNKDNGYITLFTSETGTLKSRLQIKENGDISFYEDTGATAKLTWDASAEMLTTSGLTVETETGSATPTATELKISSSTAASDWVTTDNWGVLGFYSADTSGGGAGNRAQISTNMETATGAYSSLDFTLQNPSTSYTHDSWLKLQNSAASADRKVIVSADGGLDVQGTATMDGLTVDGGSGNALVNFTPSGTFSTVVDFSNAASDFQIVSFGSGSASANNFRIRDDGASRLNIAGNGDISFFEDTGTTAKLVWDASAESLSVTTLSITDGSITTTAATGDHTVFNSTGADADFRVRTGANTHSLYVQGNTGNVGIGTDSPDHTLRVDGDGRIGNLHLKTSEYTGGSGKSIWADGAGSGVLGFNSSTAMQFNTNNAEAMRIDSSGNVGIGTDSPSQDLEILNGSTGAGIRLAATGTAYWDIERDSTSGHLTFTDDGAGTVLTVGQDGNVGIGTSSPSEKLQINDGRLRFLESSQRQYNVGIVSGTPDFAITDATYSVERLRIDSSGNLLVGKTSASAGSGGVRINNNGTYGGRIELSRENNTGTQYSVQFYDYAGSTVGSISNTTTATSYNTSSDQRLKENIADADDAGSKVDAIQVRSFDWKADGSHQDYGMIAQELIEVAPEAVSAPEDPEEMMSVDYSKLVPMLVKEIQQLRQRVAQLEE